MSKLRSIINDIFHEGTASFKKNNEYSLFKDIYAHDDIKQIIVMALKAQQPVHILLTGEPGCGKTQFLEDIKSHYKDKAFFTIGAHSTKAGMLDHLFEKRPRILLIDEIEHMPAKDQAVLLSLMHSQIISETKYGKTRQTQVKCSVFATSNSTKKMLDPLLSRFVTINVQRYSYKEFKEIAMRVHRKRRYSRQKPSYSNNRRSMEEKLLQNASICDVIKIARLARNVHDIRLIVRTIVSAENNSNNNNRR